jgi:abortive infection bacteriophage resistance protein
MKMNLSYALKPAATRNDIHDEPEQKVHLHGVKILKNACYKCTVHPFSIYSVEITVISKLMTFAKNAETGQFLFLIMLILSYFTCS